MKGMNKGTIWGIKNRDFNFFLATIRIMNTFIRSPPAPAPLSSHNAYTSWPGGVDPSTPLFNTDNQFKTGGSMARRSRRASRRRNMRRRKNTRRNRK
jgi:hypothetical protein